MIGICDYCQKEGCQIIQISPARIGWRSVYDAGEPDRPIYCPVDLWALWKCGHVTPLEFGDDGSWYLPFETDNFCGLIPPGATDAVGAGMIKRHRERAK